MTPRTGLDIAAGVPICGLTGANGAGKTLLAVQSCMADLAAGRRVFSNVPISTSFGDASPIRGLRHLLEIEDATVLLDEISTVFSARSTSTLPGEARIFLDTLRKRRITFRWTAPSWSSCDVVLRRVTQAVATVRPLIRRRTDSPWPRPLLSAVGLLDTMGIPQDAAPDRVLRRRFFVPSRSPAWGLYDSMFVPEMFGVRAVDGLCPDCGGTRPRVACSPERHAKLDVPWVPSA